jgi:ABC-type multidrug transport system ATPase subunit
LRFYGRLKNLSGKNLSEAVEASLKSVNLHEENKKLVSQYSGGMKRMFSKIPERFI